MFDDLQTGLSRVGPALLKFSRRAGWAALARLVEGPSVEVLFEEEGSVVLRYSGDLYIEPKWGYLINGRGHLVESVLEPNFPHPKRPMRIAVPSVFNFFWSTRVRTRIAATDQVLSARHLWEWNYYHFYFDVLAKLELAEHAGVSEDNIVIARYVDELAFARPILQSGTLATRQWLASNGEYVRARSVIVCRTKRPYRDRVSFINRNVSPTASVHPSSDGDDLRIFVTRSGTRRIGNWSEIEPVLQGHGFEVVDCAAMTMEEQQSTFRNARFVVAIHGAGTTNIIYRGDRPLQLLELHHENYMNFDHRKICEEMGYDWDHLEGVMLEGAVEHAHFDVDAASLDRRIEELDQIIEAS